MMRTCRQPVMTFSLTGKYNKSFVSHFLQRWEAKTSLKWTMWKSHTLATGPQLFHRPMPELWSMHRCLHAQNMNGAGVTVAVIDTGFYPEYSLLQTLDGQWRLLEQYDAVAGETRAWVLEHRG